MSVMHEKETSSLLVLFFGIHSFLARLSSALWYVYRECDDITFINQRLRVAFFSSFRGARW
jgi:hypothetical protein